MDFGAIDRRKALSLTLAAACTSSFAASQRAEAQQTVNSTTTNIGTAWGQVFLETSQSSLANNYPNCSDLRYYSNLFRSRATENNSELNSVSVHAWDFRYHLDSANLELALRRKELDQAIKDEAWDVAFKTLKVMLGLLLFGLAVRYPPTTSVGMYVVCSGLLKDSGFQVIQLFRQKDVGSFLLGYMGDKVLTIGQLVADAQKSVWKQRIGVLFEGFSLLRDSCELATDGFALAVVRGKKNQYTGFLEKVVSLCEPILPLSDKNAQEGFSEVALSTANTLDRIIADTSSFNCKIPSEKRTPPTSTVTPHAPNATDSR